MKNPSQINPKIINRIFLIFLIFISSYLVSLFIVYFTYSKLIVLTILFVALMLSLAYPKSFIYFVLIMFPLLPLFWGGTGMMLGDSKSLRINIGGIYKIIVLCFGILYLIHKRTNIFKDKMFIPIVLFTSLSLAGLFLSSEKMYGFRQWVVYTMPVIFYFLILESFDDLKEAIRLFKTALILYCIPSIVNGYYLIFSYVPPVYIDPKELSAIDKYARFGGVINQANIFGLQLDIFIMLSIYFYFNARNRLIYTTVFISMLGLLFFTLSRSAWGAFLAAVSIIGLLRYKKTYIQFMLFIALVIAFVPFVSDRVSDRINDPDKFKPRINTVTLAWNLFKESPILGHGPGGFDTSFEDSKKGLYGVAGHDAHNEYMTLLVEGGIPLLGLYLFMIYRCFMLAVQVFKLPDKSGSDFGLFMMSTIIIILVVGFTNSSYREVGIYLWTAMAVGQIHLRQAGISHPEIAT
ncbi:MAG: O-antigen ligase family protein [Nitrospirae bacterium]|nr:O-antigen ligase family protein [Nitrospirota bacterium]